MIKPILREIVWVSEPEDISDFAMGLEADICEEGDIGSDSFAFTIMTPVRLCRCVDEDKVINGKAMFIVNELDMDSNIKLVTAEINKILENCSRETWEEVALAINCYLDWEYYDPTCGMCDFYKRTRNIE